MTVRLSIRSSVGSSVRPSVRPSVVERPRERLHLYGKEALSDLELVALVLGGGQSMERAWSLLQHVGGLAGLERACPAELADAPGIGEAGASALAAAFELSRRAAQLALPYDTPVENPRDVVEALRARLAGATQETFVVVGLDARQRVRLVRTVALGSLASVEVHPREVFRPLVRAGMHSAIAVHNHPSGDAEPSPADIELTHRLVEVGRLVGIPLLDHLVVGGIGYSSLAQRGLMEP